jgi:hypothetical protein
MIYDCMMTKICCIVLYTYIYIIKLYALLNIVPKKYLAKTSFQKKWEMGIGMVFFSF